MFTLGNGLILIWEMLWMIMLDVMLVVGLGYCYNGDSNDETASGYGIDPPAIGSNT